MLGKFRRFLVEQSKNISGSYLRSMLVTSVISESMRLTDGS